MDKNKEYIDQARGFCSAIHDELKKSVIGFHSELEQLDIAFRTGGHVLLEGVPGLAKTLFVRSLAKAAGLKFKRIQFTPDLMPSDITGSLFYNEEKQDFKFIEGPLFANIVLADEINRTPPKTQAALLESMQEKSVTVAQNSHKTPDPFFVFATQNPIEQEGTYPLPEAQLDRFLFKLILDYPSLEDEKKIALLRNDPESESIQPIAGIEHLQKIQHAVQHILCAEDLVDEIIRLVASTRPGREGSTKEVNQFVEWGAGPRASKWILSAAKARAALSGRYHVDREDIKFVTPAILRHRILLNYHSLAENLTTDRLIENLIREKLPR